MPHMEDMIAAEDDRRHAPGPEREWNESYWFSFYDPAREIGVMNRVGLLVNKRQANLWFFVSQEGKIVYNGTHLNLPLPDGDIDNLPVGPFTLQCLTLLRDFRLTYRQGNCSLDVIWSAFMPVYNFGHGLSNVARYHIEQAGKVTGEVILGGERISLQCLGYRDHSAGERDWTALGRWNWIEAQFGTDFSFNAVRMILGEGVEKWGGFVFNQGKMMRIRLTECEVETDSSGTVQRRGRFSFRDEEGRTYQVQGEVLDICPVDLGATNCNDAFARFRMDDQVGYGIIELGYQH